MPKVLRTTDWQFIKGRLEVDAMQSRTDAARFLTLANTVKAPSEQTGYRRLGDEFTRMAEKAQALAVDLAEMYDLD